MNHIILKYSCSPGFSGEFISKDLLISKTFETKLQFFWYFDPGYFPDNDEKRKQQRRFITIKDKLPEALQKMLEKILQSDIRVIAPEIIRTDKIEYASTNLPSSEFYTLEIQHQEKDIHIPYDISNTLIEGNDVNLFFDFHTQLTDWINREFEIASDGKAVKFNKENNGGSQ